jgi:hypothetical protein
VSDHARTHIKAMIDTLKEERPEKLAQPAGLFLSGMLTGLAASAQILNGSTAEAEMERVEVNLAAAIGHAYLNGSLPSTPPIQDAADELRKINALLMDNGVDGDLGARGVHTLTTAARARLEDLTRVEAERDGAYRERAHLVALLAAMTDDAVIAAAPDVEEPGWQIVYLRIGGRQASWHISPRDADLFQCVPHVDAGHPLAQWDGHTTEDKYRDIHQHTRDLFHQVDDSDTTTPDVVHPVQNSQAAIDRVRKALDDRPPLIAGATGQPASEYEAGWRDHDLIVRRALDGTEQPTASEEWRDVQQ